MGNLGRRGPRIRGPAGRLSRALALLVLLAGYWFALRHGVAGAQANDTTVEALARVCAAEAGWDTRTGDCAAIVHLLRRRAQRHEIRVATMARLYSSRHFDRERLDRRRWIAGLRLDGRRPGGWPGRLPWSRYRAAWRQVIAHVRAVLRGEVGDPCPGADHWGGPMDDWRARAAGWARVECSSSTRNRFWNVPQAPSRGGDS